MSLLSPTFQTMMAEYKVTQSISLISFGIEPREQRLVGNYLCRIRLRLEGSDVHTITNIRNMTEGYFLTATIFSLMQGNHINLEASEAYTV